MSFFSKRHSRADKDDIHTIVWKEVLDTAARVALVVAEDKEGRVVRQLDNDSLWVLVD